MFVCLFFLVKTWNIFRDYEYINSTSFDISNNELTLLPGYKYRITLKLCAKETCFKPVSTDGIMIISSPPKTGSLTVEHQDGRVFTKKNKQTNIAIKKNPVLN
jgi:hypothetical protein